GIKNAGDGYAVFFEGEIFSVEVRTLYYLAEIHAGFGDGKTIDRGTFVLISVDRHSSVSLLLPETRTATGSWIWLCRPRVPTPRTPSSCFRATATRAF